jgi:hypothetical protein
VTATSGDHWRVEHASTLHAGATLELSRPRVVANGEVQIARVSTDVDGQVCSDPPIFLRTWDTEQEGTWARGCTAFARDAIGIEAQLSIDNPQITLHFEPGRERLRRVDVDVELPHTQIAHYVVDEATNDPDRIDRALDGETIEGLVAHGDTEAQAFVLPGLIDGIRYRIGTRTSGPIQVRVVRASSEATVRLDSQ